MTTARHQQTDEPTLLHDILVEVLRGLLVLAVGFALFALLGGGLLVTLRGILESWF